MDNGFFWVASVIMVMAVMAVIAFPFLRRPRKILARAEYDLAIYKDQMRELEDDIAAGEISGEEAKAARNEIARRILAADTARQRAANAIKDKGSATGRGIVMLLALALVPALAYGVYVQKGRPGMPDMPIAKRLAVAAQRHDTSALIKRVEDRLAKHPDDIEGWLALAPVYSRQGQYAKAANAWKNAIRLSKKPDPDLYNALGESLVYANRGKVIPQARDAFSKALKLAPKNPMSRYFLAMAEVQSGDRKKALADLKSLLRDLPADFGGRPIIERQIAKLEGKPAGEKPKPATAQKQREKTSSAPKSASAPATDGGPTPEQVKARMKRLQGMTPQARQEMIRNMVDGLEQKLKDNPDDLGGWLRLIKARAVLGQKDKAQAAYEAAREAFKGQDKRIQALDSLATRQGLKALSPVSLPPVKDPAAKQ